MVTAWLFTLPMAGLVGGMAARIANTGTLGVLGVAFVLVTASATMYLLNRRTAVTAATVNDVETFQQPVAPSRLPAEEQKV
jgi:PiT family inorganic phosphate transporter